MSETAPRYVSCPCQICSGRIEFDANQLDPAEKTTVPCPHCGMETIIFVPPEPTPLVIPPPIIPSDIPAEPPRLDPEDASQFDADMIELMRKGAHAGHAGAQGYLGALYMTGHGMPRDYHQGLIWLGAAAEKGDAQAQFNFGTAYYAGWGVAKSFIKAVEWWRKAAEQGFALAQNNLAACYQKGLGVPKDAAHSVKWTLRAARQGDASAQLTSAECFDEGQDVARDYVEAYKWAKLAAAQKHEGAQALCDKLAGKMTEEQIKEGEQRFASFKVVPEQRVPAAISDAPFNLRQSSAVTDSEKQLESLTPKHFSDFIGQARVKERLEVAIAAAKCRGESLGHILLVGSPGSGKATLAGLIANTMGASLKDTNGPAIEKPGDLAGLLTNLEEGDVLFIDEIHRLRRSVGEYLPPALKDFKLDIDIDQGPTAQRVRLNLPRFTLIGSTTSKEQLTRNLFSCFQIVVNMDAYSIDALTTIARRFAKALKVEIDGDAADRIARSADGTPLDTLNRLQLARDYASVRSDGTITLKVTELALKMLAEADETREDSEKRDAIPSEIRREVWRRDGGKCVKCGSREKLEYDHIIPVSKGGSNTARNIELLCEACNRAKSDLIQ